MMFSALISWIRGSALARAVVVVVGGLIALRVALRRARRRRGGMRYSRILILRGVCAAMLIAPVAACAPAPKPASAALEAVCAEIGRSFPTYAATDDPRTRAEIEEAAAVFRAVCKADLPPPAS